MCLEDVNFALRYWPAYDTYVGTGYKILYPDSTIKFDEWEEAVGWDNNKPNKIAGITKDGKPEYHAGFHIFLKPEHAKEYDLSEFNDGVMKVYKVDFTDVLAFGPQRAGKAGNVDCVIARWMYVHKTPVLSAPEPEPEKDYVDGCNCYDCRTARGY